MRCIPAQGGRTDRKARFGHQESIGFLHASGGNLFSVLEIEYVSHRAACLVLRNTIRVVGLYCEMELLALAKHFSNHEDKRIAQGTILL